MTDDRLAQIEARLSAATPGPWRIGYWSPDEPEVNAILAEEQTFVVCADEDPIKPADAALIAHAPDDLRYLLDALAAERAAARGYLERAERAEAERDRSASVRDAEAQRRTQAEARMRHLHAGLVALSFEMCPPDGRRLRDAIGGTS